MTVNLRTPSGLKEIGAISLRTPVGLKEIAEVWLRTPTGLIQVFGAFSITSSTNFVDGSTSSHTAVSITTGPVTITVDPPGSVDSVVWDFADGGWSAVAPTSLSTRFRSPPVSPGDSTSTSINVTVTRGVVSVVLAVPISANADNFGT